MADLEVRLGQEYIDLTEHLHIDDFDRVVRAVHGVIDQSDSLSLDNADDREVVKSRLLKSLGCVVEPSGMRLQAAPAVRRRRKPSERQLDEMADSGELTGIAMRMAIDAGADWPSLDGDAQDAWHEAAIRMLQGKDPHE